MNFTVQEAKRWHCGEMIRNLRPEQTDVAKNLGFNAHEHLQEAFMISGISKTWFGEDGKILGMMGVTGPMMAEEGMIWLAVSKEATKFPIFIVKQAINQLAELMLFKNRLYAAPFLADPASVKFARSMGFIEMADQSGAQEIGAVAMVMSLNMEAYNIKNRINRVN